MVPVGRALGLPPFIQQTPTGRLQDPGHPALATAARQLGGQRKGLLKSTSFSWILRDVGSPQGDRRTVSLGRLRQGWGRRRGIWRAEACRTPAPRVTEGEESWQKAQLKDHIEGAPRRPGNLGHQSGSIQRRGSPCTQSASRCSSHITPTSELRPLSVHPLCSQQQLFQPQLRELSGLGPPVRG